MPKVNFAKIGLKFHQNWLYYLSETRVFAKDRLRFSCWGLVILHWNDQINMLLSHLGEMTKFHLLFYISEMTQCTCFVTFWSNVAIYALCRIWLKCRDLRALLYLAEMLRFTRFVAFGWNVAIYALCRILAEMSRFTRFARHKMSAPRHLKLFCTPAYEPYIMHVWWYLVVSGPCLMVSGGVRILSGGVWSMSGGVNGYRLIWPDLMYMGRYLFWSLLIKCKLVSSPS